MIQYTEDHQPTIYASRQALVCLLEGPSADSISHDLTKGPVLDLAHGYGFWEEGEDYSSWTGKPPCTLQAIRLLGQLRGT